MRACLRTLLPTAVVLLASAGPALAATPSTDRASVANGTGIQGNLTSISGTVSDDGRYVAFESAASNLVPGDTNASGDVFLRDRATGETRRISLGPDGKQVPNGTPNARPTISQNGRYVAFSAEATELSPPLTGRRVFRYDIQARRLDLTPAAPAGFTSSDDVSIDASGNRMAYTAISPGGQWEVFMVDAGSGAVQLVTTPVAGGTANGNSYDPAISPDGRFVAFTTAATNLATPDANGFRDVVLRDTTTGTYTLISRATGTAGAQANNSSSTPALSLNGCQVAFYSAATNIAAGDTGVTPKVFVRDRCASTPTTVIASVSNAGTPGTASSPLAISNDGCQVAFPAGNILSPPPAAGTLGAALRDVCASTTARQDLATTGDPGDSHTYDLSISGNGRYLAFSSASTTLVPGDTNASYDVFVRDRGTNAAPSAALTIARSGRTVSADATASSDSDGWQLSGSIAFGDGSAPATGLKASHEYTRAGTYSVTATVTDADGTSTSRSESVTISDPPAAAPGGPAGGAGAGAKPLASPLTLNRLSLSRTTFALAPARGPSRGNRGARLSLRLSEPATLTLTFERKQSGRRKAGKCVHNASKGSRCTLYTAEGKITKSLPAGASTVALTGRLSATKALPRGAHRLTVQAVAADGRRSAAKAYTITIVRARG